MRGQLRYNTRSHACAWRLDMLSKSVLYNQTLADVRSTGAGIKCLCCISTTVYLVFSGLISRYLRSVISA